PVPELEGMTPSPGFPTSWEENLGNVTFPVLCSLCRTILPLLFKAEGKTRLSINSLLYGSRFIDGNRLGSSTSYDSKNEDITHPQSQEEKQRNCWLPEPADGYNTVKSALTVQEYFAKRMAKLKGPQNETETKVDDSCPTADEVLEPSEELRTKVKKKKKKQKRAEAERTEHCEKPEAKQSKIGGLNGKELDAPLSESHSGKKKRKHKEQQEGEGISCDENTGYGGIYTGISEGEDLGVRDYEAKQKKRHKKQHKRQEEETEERIEGAQRKKKKHCKHV
ncbi:PREDICTED: PIN2/TERF1-interacting telomerase inhibitor 1-like, partial [Leptosomus discolor]|uniref:PIN2/TERF1-interacting telomerase inhibitor 1-like n=1 Tax=Leptosomus discolor TaxID=188344 RepID=UPI0005225C69